MYIIGVLRGLIMIKKHWKKCRYNPKYKMCENVQTNNLKEIIEGYILP